MKKPSANERRLAKLLREAIRNLPREGTWADHFAAFLAKKGVLAVCAKTVPSYPAGWLHSYFLKWLRRFARGSRGGTR